MGSPSAATTAGPEEEEGGGLRRPNGANGRDDDDAAEEASSSSFVMVHAPSDAGSSTRSSSFEHTTTTHRPSLFRDPTMPPLARWAVPLLLLANDALLLYSNFGHGATVHVRIFDGATGGGQTRSVESASLYTITLGRSIRDMWNAKAYFTSVLIAVFAGAWPHVKCLASLLCWFLDGRCLGPDTRRVLMTLAYVMQKLSHVETFVLVILMTGGSIKAHLPEHDDWGVRSVIRPQAGFYCFLAGLCCSMFLGRVALHYDFRVTAAFDERQEDEEHEQDGPEYAALHGGGGRNDEEEVAAVVEEEEGTGEESDSDENGGQLQSPAGAAGEDGARKPRKRQRSHSRSRSSSRSSTGGCGAALQHAVDTVGVPSGSACQDIGLSYFLLGLLAFFLAGLAVPCFRFTYQGLTGWFLSHVTQDWPDVSPPTKASTVVSLGLGVPAVTDNPDAFGPRYIQAAYFFFVVGAPLGCLVLLLAISLLPVRMGGKLLTAAEVLYAWSAPDVLFVSMVTLTLEIQNFVRFVLGDRCDGLNAILRAVFDKELEGDDVCFDMVASMEKGIWIYGAASLVFFALGALILRNAQREYAPYAARQRKRERQQQQQRRRRLQREEGGGANGGGGAARFSSFWWRSFSSRTTASGSSSSSLSSSLSPSMPLLLDEEQEGGQAPLLPPVPISVQRP